MRTRFIKLMVVVSIIFGTTILASAQPAGQRQGRQKGQRMNSEQMAKMRADEMNELLKLTEEQYKKIVELFKSNSQQQEPKPSEEAKNNRQRAQRADREVMQKNLEEQNAKIKAILTEEQFKIWSEVEKNRRGGPGGPGGGRPQRNL